MMMTMTMVMTIVMMFEDVVRGVTGRGRARKPHDVHLLAGSSHHTLVYRVSQEKLFKEFWLALPMILSSMSKGRGIHYI